MSRFITDRNLIIVNFTIVSYFILIWLINLYNVHFFLLGVFIELLTIPFLIAQIVFLVIGIKYLIQNDSKVMTIFSTASLAICTFITIRSFF